jgi:hypothetical protein
MLLEQWRTCLSTEGDTGFLICADACEESEQPENRRFGELLRKYVEIQTFVRTSTPIPVELSTRYAELNKSFDPRDGFIEYGLRYSNQFGPFFLKLEADMGVLAANMMALEAEPIRQLQINGAEADGRFNTIMRNHRMDYMNELTINFSYNKRRQEAEIGKLVAELKSACLQRVTLSNIANRLNIVPALFMGKAKVPKGCELLIGSQRVAVKS